MFLEEFDQKFKSIGMKHRLDIQCSDCNEERNVVKEKARATILFKGRYLCRSCSMKQRHIDTPFTKETTEKLRSGRLGKKHSQESKDRMSRAKKAFFQTPAGKALKQKLSLLTAKGHSENKYENAKRNGWYESSKAGKVFYGSSYELLLCYQLDQDDYIKTYKTQIVYEINGRGRCLDFLVTDIHGAKRAIEVKPEFRLNEQKNVDQIEDSRLHAEKMGWSFEVVTEVYFDMTYREIRDWADAFLSELGDFDWTEHRKESNKKKAKKHYDNVIAKDTVAVWCDYCQETHQPLRLTYKKNIARNDGQYICEKHGGFIAGSKPKKKKENPYAFEGKKQCNECKEVKLFNEFGVDKNKLDGYATRCKICRSGSARKKYHD